MARRGAYCSIPLGHLREQRGYETPSSLPPPLAHHTLFSQILSHRKPPSTLGVTPAPVPTSLGLPPGPSNYLLPGSLPIGGCGSTPPTPTGLAPASDKREGSSSSEGRGDTDKYLKKLHTQERAVEEVKLAIKPYYQKKDITKEEYKDILRKAVHKVGQRDRGMGTWSRRGYRVGLVIESRSRVPWG